MSIDDQNHSSPGSEAPGTPPQATPPAMPSPPSGGPEDQTAQLGESSGVSSPVLSKLSEMGLDASSFSSDEDAIESLVDLAGRYARSQDYVRYGEQVAPHWDKFQEFLEQQQASQPKAKPSSSGPEESEDPWSWDAPEFDPAWRYQVDENGNLRPGADPALAHKIAKYYSWREEAMGKLLQDPRRVILDATQKQFVDHRKQIEQEVDRRVQQAIAQWESRHEVNQYIQQNMREFYVVDANGVVKRDPLSGQPVLTPKGKALSAYAQEARDLGLKDERAVRQYADKQLQADIKSGKFGQPAQPEAPKAKGEEKRATFLEEALSPQRTVNRDGTFPDNPATEPPQSRMPRSTSAVQIARRLGFLDD